MMYFQASLIILLYTFQYVGKKIEGGNYQRVCHHPLVSGCRGSRHFIGLQQAEAIACAVADRFAVDLYLPAFYGN